MIIDCDTCAMRSIGCGDCVITAILGTGCDVAPVDFPRDGQRRDRIEFDGPEQAAISALAGGGLVAPLRLVPALDSPARRAG